MLWTWREILLPNLPSSGGLISASSVPVAAWVEEKEKGLQKLAPASPTTPDQVSKVCPEERESAGNPAMPETLKEAAKKASPNSAVDQQATFTSS